MRVSHLDKRRQRSTSRNNSDVLVFRDDAELDSEINEALVIVTVEELLCLGDEGAVLGRY